MRNIGDVDRGLYELGLIMIRGVFEMQRHELCRLYILLTRLAEEILI